MASETSRTEQPTIMAGHCSDKGGFALKLFQNYNHGTYLNLIETAAPMHINAIPQMKNKKLKSKIKYFKTFAPHDKSLISLLFLNTAVYRFLTNVLQIFFLCKMESRQLIGQNIYAWARSDIIQPAFQPAPWGMSKYKNHFCCFFVGSTGRKCSTEIVNPNSPLWP